MFKNRSFFLLKTLIAAIALLFCITFMFSDLLRAKHSLASELGLPEPTQILSFTKKYDFPRLIGMSVNREDTYRLKFILDNANPKPNDKQTAERLVKYFLGGLTIPDEKMWVNLSPYESDRVIDANLAATDLGRDLLASDYILKQLSSSMTHPDTEIGKTYWNTVKKSGRLADKNKNELFNKIWILPGKIVLQQDGDSVLIRDAELKVMYEEDYLALKANGAESVVNSSVGNVMIGEFLPALEKEINSGENFAVFRQLFYSLILANWFKYKFQDTAYDSYIDTESSANIDLKDPQHIDYIFTMYTESFDKGVYNVITKNSDRKSCREYFSGGVGFQKMSAVRGIIEDAITSSSIEYVAEGAVEGIEVELQRRQRTALSELKHYGSPRDAVELIDDSGFLLKTTDADGATVYEPYFILSSERASWFEKIVDEAADHLEDGKSVTLLVPPGENNYLVQDAVKSVCNFRDIKLVDMPDEADPETMQTLQVMQNPEQIIMNNFDSTNPLHVEVYKMFKENGARILMIDIAGRSSVTKRDYSKDVLGVEENEIFYISPSARQGANLYNVLKMKSGMGGNDCTTDQTLSNNIAKIVKAAEKVPFTWYTQEALERDLYSFVYLVRSADYSVEQWEAWLLEHSRAGINVKSSVVDGAHCGVVEFETVPENKKKKNLEKQGESVENNLEVEKILRERIAAEGRITYAEFMEICLYSEHGYYSGGHVAIGQGQHFATYPETIPKAFGAVMGEQIIELWERMGKPNSFDIIESGAGNGTMAKNILEYLQKTDPDGIFQAVKYNIAEISRELILRQRKNIDSDVFPVSWVNASANALPFKDVEGIFISNELPDAFPVNIVKKDVNGDLKEIYVTEKNGRFVPVLGDLSEESIMKECVDILKEKRGDESIEYRLKHTGVVVNLGMLQWQKQLSQIMKRGYVITNDYGPGKRLTGENERFRNLQPAVRMYSADINIQPNNAVYPFLKPGAVDLTADVDFLHLASEGEKHGFTNIGVTTQHDYFKTMFSMNPRLDEFASEIERVAQTDNWQVMIQGKDVDMSAIDGLYPPTVVTFDLLKGGTVSQSIFGPDPDGSRKEEALNELAHRYNDISSSLENVEMDQADGLGGIDLTGMNSDISAEIEPDASDIKRKEPSSMKIKSIKFDRVFAET